MNVIPKLLQYQVSSELFRIMLGTATLMLVVGDMKVTMQVCVQVPHGKPVVYRHALVQ